MIEKYKKTIEFYNKLNDYQNRIIKLSNKKIDLLDEYNLLNNEVKKILENKLQNCYVDNNKMFDALINKYFDGYCYSGSLFFSLIFDKNPRLLRGDLSLGTYGFNHGWVELKYNNKIYVFDTTFIGLYEKDIYYKIMRPINIIEISKSDILNYYFNENFGIILNDSISFNGINSDIDYYNIEKFLKGEFFFDKNKIYKLNAKIHL